MKTTTIKWFMWLFGVCALAGLAAFLAFYQNSPGPLSAPHARILAGSMNGSCQQCHTEEGLDAGCLACHSEIAAQLEQGQGYHAHLKSIRDDSCSICHPEHLGHDFQSLEVLAWKDESREDFSHPHADFKLTGAHDELNCKACHEEMTEPFALPDFPEHPRSVSFLGLEQDCAACHEDIHGGGTATRDCEQCHDQTQFKPAARFDHSRHFKLEGPHATAACIDCHQQDQVDLPSGFGPVDGLRCIDCHESPHRFPSLGKGCVECHQASDENWLAGQRGVDSARHAGFGFVLEKPHADLSCAACHVEDETYVSRFPEPARKPHQCSVCHADPHAGQFPARPNGCLACHFNDHFLPSKVTPTQHTVYPLTGGHQAVGCNQCHTVVDEARRFAETPISCKACHDNPHGNQFKAQLAAGDCTSCHLDDASSFRIRPYTHQGNALFFAGVGHRQADCRQCHFERDAVIQFNATQKACAACHTDIHRGQFRLGGKTDCFRCHTSTAEWSAQGFNHETQSAFSLEGGHSKLACSACHRPVPQPDGRAVIQFKPLTTRCEDCHEFDSK